MEDTQKMIEGFLKGSFLEQGLRERGVVFDDEPAESYMEERARMLVEREVLSEKLIADLDEGIRVLVTPLLEAVNDYIMNYSESDLSATHKRMAKMTDELGKLADICQITSVSRRD